MEPTQDGYLIAEQFPNAPKQIFGAYLSRIVPYKTFAHSLLVRDSEGKKSPGVMELNTRWLGFYDECVRAKKIVDGEVKIRGKYCKSRIALDFRKGVCVPHTCTADDLKAILQANITEVSQSIPGPYSVPDIVECVEDIPWITGDYVTLVICGIIGLLLIAGTLYDVLERHNTAKPKAKDKPSAPDIQLQSYAKQHQEIAPNGITENGSTFEEITPKEISGNGIITIEQLSNSAATQNVIGGHENGGFTVAMEEDKQRSVSTQEQIPKIEKLEGSRTKGLGHEVLLSFSVLTNGEKLFNFSSAGGQLEAINGLRALSFGWVILGHTYSFLLTYVDNFAVVDVYLKRPEYHLIFSGVYAVDTFFFLSGLLVAYSTLKHLRKTKGRLNWFLFYIHRYIRLTVVYGFTILLMATVYRHVNKGMFQNKIAEDRQSEVTPLACQKYWWTNILYINNFYPEYGTLQCHGVGWYMANDMQLFIISPLYIYVLYKNNIAGHLVVLSGILATFLANGITSWKYDLSCLFLFGREPVTPEQGEYGGYMYTRPYYRMGAYLVGISVGEILLHKPTILLHKPKLNKVLIGLGWIVALVLHYLLIFGLYPMYRDGGISMSTEMDALYNATHRTMWAVSLGWIVYACSHGLGGPINWFLSWNIWGPVSRLSFAGYMIHPMVMITLITGQQGLIHLNDFTGAVLFMASITAVLPIAAILSLSVEAPIIRLQKLLLGSK